MATINIIYDFGVIASRFFHDLLQDREKLVKSDVIIAPDNPWTCQLVPTHNFYWGNYGEKLPEPAFVKSDTKILQDNLKAGKDILLFCDSRNPVNHDKFFERVKNDFNYPVRSLVLIGTPAFALENFCRAYINLPNEKAIESQINLFNGLPQLIQKIKENYGEENITVFPVLMESPTLGQNQKIFEQVLSWLAIGFIPDMEKPLLHPLFFQSQTARRFSRLPEVRWNSWPELKIGEYFNALKKADEEWGEQIILPSKYRQSVEKAAAIFERMFDLPQNSLTAPQWFIDATEADAKRLITSQETALFIDKLPEQTCRILEKRYEQDKTLLNSEQKIFAASLKSSAHFGHIEVNEPEPLLTVLTMAYNHEKFIGECMDSVLMQKTDFSVRHIVLDHCSPDRTGEIIANYAAKHPSIQPVLLSARKHPENVHGLFSRCKSKYAALCDGDDYFTDPLKLQKQVDFLEKNPECGLCFHPVRVHFDDGSKEDFIYPPQDLLPRGIKEKYFLSDLFTFNMIQTNSAVYRWRFRDGLPDWFDATLCPSDWYWHLLHAEMGPIGYIPEVMSVYRRHGNALYNNAFTDLYAHRRKTGMKELHAYEVINKHFQDRFKKKILNLAANVFNDYLQIYLDTEDSSLLDEACAKYPEFGQHFLKLVEEANPDKVQSVIKP